MPNSEAIDSRIVGYVVVRHSTGRNGDDVRNLDSPFGEREEGSTPVWLSLDLALKRVELLELEGDLGLCEGAVVVPLYGDPRCPLPIGNRTADWALEIGPEEGAR